MSPTRRTLALIAAAACGLTLGGCNAPPAPAAPCVCECAPCEAAPAAAPATPAPAASSTPATPPAPTRAGRASAAPGSGNVVELDGPGRREMHTVFGAFLDAAGKKDMDAMRTTTTKRLGDTLLTSTERYGDRLYRGLAQAIQAGTKGMKLVETREMGGGNVEALFHFPSGYDRRVVFFKEDGKWLLNRL
ncbi:MAG: hypothetical protein H6746_19395 [Deltaproteobacteria bacterium]|nr:hypothetical protein [Deltaproteobacteria bacterium]